MVELDNVKANNIAAMNHDRSAHATVFFEGCVFVAGGQSVSKKKTFVRESFEK